MKLFKSVLIISDLHSPYMHVDTHLFLSSLKAKYKPDLVVSVGDEIDGHAWSFHPSDPDLFSPGDELLEAIEGLKPIYKLFPKMKIVDSNHGSLIYRKQKFHGLPRSVFKSYREIIQAPKGWTWSYDLTIKVAGGHSVYVCHGKSSNAIKLSQTMGMCTINGHYHEQFNVQYWGSPAGLFWSMVVGCLIDDKSRAYDYNNTNLKRPIIGCGGIINGQPKLFPMVLNKNGRWNGEVP